jgi:hypothetical protein
VGEAISGQIATAFSKTGTPWNDALRAVGIVGIVVAVITRLVVREPPRRQLLAQPIDTTAPGHQPESFRSKLAQAKTQLFASVEYVVSMKSFWILTLSSGARQFSGNVFGWYMPSYLGSLYPNETELFSHYGIIVGVVGSVTVLLGGAICCAYPRRPTVALYLTGIGGMISAPFVICMVFSLRLAGEDEKAGVRILYGVMSAAYFTAELWLGAFASLLALLLPTRTKTFCLAIYTSTIILIYSSAPQMIGLGLQDYTPGSQAYIHKTRDILAILIPIGYWVAGVGFLLAIPKVNQDIRIARVDGAGRPRASKTRQVAFLAFAVLLGSLTIAFFVVSLTVGRP